MNKIILEELFACPRCKTLIRPRGAQGNCTKCRFFYKKVDGIWDFLSFKKQKTKSWRENEKLHKYGSWGRISDGSYEILAAMARGNRTIDIACGEGWVEKLAPQTVAVDFSLSALNKAKKNGAKYLFWANAENLPFIDNAFDLAICAGSLENIENPQKVIKEMARISQIQVLTVHRYPPFPFASDIYRIATRIFSIKHQPIERPINARQVTKMLENAKLHVVFKGIWTLPVNYGRPIKFLPEFKNIPSSWFIISIKKI